MAKDINGKDQTTPEEVGAVRSESNRSAKISPATEKQPDSPQPDGAEHEGSTARKATGPRSPQGKRRSRYNALRDGLFSKVLLLKGESRDEYRSLVEGLIEDLKPVGQLEMTLVDELGVIRWRKRRCVQSDRAQISKEMSFKALDSLLTHAIEKWDWSRAGEGAGGMLRNRTNPLLIRDAIRILEECRELLEKDGFQPNEDPWRLRKVYGLNLDGSAPFGLFRTYQIYARLATDPSKAGGSSVSPDELKKEMIAESTIAGPTGAPRKGPYRC